VVADAFFSAPRAGISEARTFFIAGSLLVFGDHDGNGGQTRAN